MANLYKIICCKKYNVDYGSKLQASLCYKNNLWHRVIDHEKNLIIYINNVIMLLFMSTETN